MQATAHGVTKSRARLSNFTHSLTHSLNDATIPISRTYEYVTLDDKRALRLLIHQPRGREIILDYLGRPSNQQDP